MKISYIKGKAAPILKRYGIKRAGVFGSFVRGEAKKTSDVDIVVDIGRKISLFEFVRIKLELEDVLNKKVDLVEYKTIKPALKQRILSEEVSIL